MERWYVAMVMSVRRDSVGMIGCGCRLVLWIQIDIWAWTIWCGCAGIGYGVVGAADVGHRRISGDRIVPVYELYVVHKR